MNKKTNSIKTKIYIIFWIIQIAFFGTIAAIQANQYLLLQKDKNIIANEIEQQRKIGEELKKELEYYDSDFYVEKIAREKLGFVKPDEVVFYDDAKK